MEGRHRNGNKRNSGIYERHGQSVQRRTSKKASSKDRHGQIYPENFKEATIRAVTPEPATESGTDIHVSGSSFLPSSVTSSPRHDVRASAEEHNGNLFEGPSLRHTRVASDGSREQGLRPRTRTLEEGTSEESSRSLLSRTRNRIGSLQSTGQPAFKDLEEGVSSIGFPSIIPSPPLLSQSQTARQRLVKQPPRPLSPIRNVSVTTHSVSQASPTTDTSKVLQLMKTTCGRMHGILSFRTSRSGSWCSGYCAINVATGSLIYQMKGDVSHAKTLIPDLRGCQVRTLFDRETRTTFLDVSTHTSGLGIHLRPHVPETFDSWLAALLCWQPIRPKGVQDKMTKPQATIVPERRIGDRKRNSEVNLTKDAAIIKVGKMLYWNKDVRSNASTTPGNRRISTYKQQRSASTAWQKVSCTLQENGHFKLYTESDVSLVSVVPLSQLSRYAIQRLDPSVLDDEFSIAIYPQYTASNTTLPTMHPVYLSMESRVLFEVWFVLLRAFTIPELYGPEQPPPNPELDSAKSDTEELLNTEADMFRVERQLSLRIIEAKLHASRGTTASVKRTSPKAPTSGGQDWISGNYYAEVNLDGEIRAKTAVKSDTSNPFWREDYEFVDLPPVLSSASVILKTSIPGQQDWTLISRSSYDHDQGEMNPLSVVGDLEISPLDMTYGSVELELDDLERGTDIEKRWPILNEHDDTVGEMLMKVRIEEVVVLMSRDYQPLSELLHSFSSGLTQQIGSAVPTELRRLSETLLNIFQVSAQAGGWIMSLVEDEIDGIHKETPTSRLRYSRRIASNDSYDSGLEREMFLRDLGRTATVEANLLFRGNSLLTKALDLHMRRLGKEYLEDTLSERMRDIDESDPDCEVDPNRVQRPDDLQRNWRNLITLTENVWKSIYASASRCPSELRMIFRHIRACADDRYGDFLRTVMYSSVSGFLFLRFFCPAVLNPKLFGLLKDHPRPRAQRTLTLIAKSLQTLANLTTFGAKEPWMEPMNAFLTSHRQEFKSFVDAICAIRSDRATSSIPPSYATPITILSRLPATSREGFPSLPYLLDQAKEFAALVGIWLDARDEGVVEVMSDEVKRFNTLCEGLRQRTKDSLNQAEQAERPSGGMEVKWEELIEKLGRKTRLKSDHGRSIPSTPSSAIAPPSSGGSRPRAPTAESTTENSSTTSLGDSYFTHYALPRGGHAPHLPFANNRRYNHHQHNPTSSDPAPTRRYSSEAGDLVVAAAAAADRTTTPPGTSSGVWDPGTYKRSMYIPEHEEGDGDENEFVDENGDEMGGGRRGGSGSLGSSLYSLEAMAGSAPPRSPVSRDGSLGKGGSWGGGKSRFDFMLRRRVG